MTEPSTKVAAKELDQSRMVERGRNAFYAQCGQVLKLVMNASKEGSRRERRMSQAQRREPGEVAQRQVEL